MNTVSSFLRGLPTEYQFGLIMAGMMLGCFFVTIFSKTLSANLGVTLAALGSLAIGVLGHGAASRWGKPDACQDLKGG